MTDKKKKKEVSKKQEKPKKAPQKKVEKKAVKKAVISPMVHIDEFIREATEMYELSSMQQSGFKAYMIGKHYLANLEAFVPYVERYLDK